MERKKSKTNNSGFTLLEVIVVLAIITILTVLGAYALPISRDHQALVADTNQLQLILREAERGAVNEVRPVECIELAGGDSELERNCSNVGLAFRGNEVVKFSDMDGNSFYDEDGDYVINEYVLKSYLEPVDSEDWQAIVFLADPPNVEIYRNGLIVPPNDPTILTFTSGSRSRTIHVFPLRHVDFIQDVNN